MQKALSTCAVAALAALGSGAQAQDIDARVISTTPVVQQVQVPRTVCNNQPMLVQQPSTGGGAVIGSIAGGLLGSLVGGGMGTVVATGLGIVTGAAVGDNLERRGPGYVQMAQGCNTETVAENRTLGYNVTYEYGGSQRTVQMASDPGPTVRLQIAPVGAIAQSNFYPQSNVYPRSNVYSGQTMSAPANIVSVPGVVAGATTVYPAYAPQPYYAPQTYYAPQPYYPIAYSPGYYPGYYAAPIALSLGFGYSNWGHGHRHGGYRR